MFCFTSTQRNISIIIPKTIHWILLSSLLSRHHHPFTIMHCVVLVLFFLDLPCLETNRMQTETVSREGTETETPVAVLFENNVKKMYQRFYLPYAFRMRTIILMTEYILPNRDILTQCIQVICYYCYIPSSCLIFLYRHQQTLFSSVFLVYYI